MPKSGHQISENRHFMKIYTTDTDAPIYPQKCMYKYLTFLIFNLILMLISTLVYHVPQFLGKFNFLYDIGVAQVERKIFEHRQAFFGSTNRNVGKNRQNISKRVFTLLLSISIGPPFWKKKYYNKLAFRLIISFSFYQILKRENRMLWTDVEEITRVKDHIGKKQNSQTKSIVICEI